MEEAEREKIWIKYIKSLFSDERKDILETKNEMTGPAILKSEIERVISLSKNRKACGPDEIPAELVKLIDSKNINIIVTLFNQIYDTGRIPEDWLNSTFIPIPKKPKPQTCNDFRLISLTSQLLKMFLKIIHNRIYQKCEENIGTTQFGFRNGLGTREALFSLKVLCQKCTEMQTNLYLCFIDFEKAFDKVQHNKLIEVLTKIGIDKKDIRIVKNLYWNQQASILTGFQKSENIKIERGVRQGCVLSPLLFNIYSEEIFSQALEDRDEGVIINGQNLNNLRYADDTILITNNPQDLQTLLDLVDKECNKMGLNINTAKTKIMSFGLETDPAFEFKLKRKNLERVQKFKYLGSWINNNGDDEMEIRARIEMARQSFIKLRTLLCSRDLDCGLRLRMMKCYVWSNLLYGVETWTLKKND